MQSRVAGRYAKALLELAKENNKTEPVFDDINFLSGAIDQSKDLALLLKSPIIKEAVKVKAFNAVFADKLNPLTMKFLLLILAKRREANIKAITDRFLHFYFKDKGITKVTITFAEAVSKQVEKKILNRFKTQTGLHDIQVSRKVDKKIIGGFVLEYEDKILDASAKSRLKKIKHQFLTNTFAINN